MGVRKNIMSKVLNSLLAGSVAIGSVFVASAAMAADPVTSVASLDQLSQYSREGQTNAAGQVTSVSQLSDVKPTDWAFQALQSLVERYGCIVGYPDRTYRGNRALTRYEFAAGLNACMDRVNELIAAATADLVKKEDLATLQKLQEEFAAELATLRGRVDALEAKTATLEKQQFSTTTKLSGEVIFAVTDEFGTNNDNETVFQDRVRLSLNTSFTGKDLLVTRLATGNADNFRTTTGLNPQGAEGIQTFNSNANGGNRVNIDWVAYYTTLADKFNVYIPVTGGLHYDYAPTANAMDSGDSGNTTLSVFGQRNPIYGIGGGAGVGLTTDFAGFKVSAGYLSGSANNPSSGQGVFNGDNSILGQIAYAPANSPLQVALTYVSAYDKTGAIFDGTTAAGIGTAFANNVNRNLLANGSNRVNAFGASAALKLGGGLLVNAFGMLAKVDEIGDGLGDNDVWSYGASVGLQDFGKKGNLLGLVVGVEPYAPGARQGAGGIQVGRAGTVAPLHIEGFYKYQLNDKISITPGVIWVKDPGQSKSDDVFIGTVRTTFSF
jgi:Carbohydrate-selective porin, OprB family/S-layer homology domain